MARFCASCGAELMESAAFCPKCGRPAATQSSAGGAAVPPGASAPPPVTATGGGLEDNVAALLAYLLVPAIVFLFVEPYNKNKFVRFHSFQAIALGVISIVVHAILGLSLFGVVLLIPFNIFLLVVVVICMIKAYQMQQFRLPIIGDFAEKQANG